MKYQYVSLFTLAVLAGFSANANNNAQMEAAQTTTHLIAAVQDGNLKQAGINMALDKVEKEASNFLPSWMHNTELGFNLTEGEKLEGSFLTVIPLYQSEGKKNTLFTQLRAARNQQFGDSRTTTNVGLGYRHLFANDKILLGGNMFWDNEWNQSHRRLGYGLEARWSALDFYANYYDASEKLRTTESATEQSMDGYDLELTSQVPYVPWLRVRGKYFQYETIQAVDDVEGFSYSAEADVHEHVRLEGGISNDNFGGADGFMKVTFNLNKSDRPTMQNNLVSDVAFDMRDMKKHTLDKVRRENEIKLERVVAGAITISRTN